MSGFESPVIPGESLALTACRRILARTVNCGDFAWYMNHTESLSLCVQAVAEANQECHEALAEKIRDGAVAIIKKDPPRVELLRCELESMKENIADVVVEYALKEETGQLRDLLNHCQLTGQRPSIEAIEKALKGKPLCHCLNEM